VKGFICKICSSPGSDGGYRALGREFLHNENFLLSSNIVPTGKEDENMSGINDHKWT
jgi:hypothetical protein